MPGQSPTNTMASRGSVITVMLRGLSAHPCGKKWKRQSICSHLGLAREPRHNASSSKKIENKNKQNTTKQNKQNRINRQNIAQLEVGLLKSLFLMCFSVLLWQSSQEEEIVWPAACTTSGYRLLMLALYYL